MRILTNHLKAINFIKAYIHSYSNEILVNKIKFLYNLSEEVIQRLIEDESLSLQKFFNNK
jgi:hypothetical protein